MDWNARYADSTYLFGTDAAQALTQHHRLLRPASTVLCVADGEGRNSTFLAEQGHDVTAFDPSSNALDKARALARARKVEVAHEQADLEAYAWPPAAFDAVVGIFIQVVSPPERAHLFRNMAQTLSPGGVLFLHGYAPRQVAYGTGGPPTPDNMYTVPLLEEAYPGWEVLRASDYDAEIHEGTGHSGRSALIDFVARKPL